jgi:hypothetical protein
MLTKISFLLFLMTIVSVSYAQYPPIEPGVSQSLAEWRAARYSDVRYKLNLTLEKLSPVLKGTIEIRVKVGAGTLLSPSPQNGEITPRPGTRTPPSASPQSGEITPMPGTQAPSPANAGASGVTPPIILDWRKIAGHEKDSTISNVTINGIPLIGHSGEPFMIDGQAYYIILSRTASI